MQARPKTYGNGPSSYFQRVLMDGAKPYQFRPRTSVLLGKQASSAVRALSANKISAIGFTYPDTINQPELDPGTEHSRIDHQEVLVDEDFATDHLGKLMQHTKPESEIDAPKVNIGQEPASRIDESGPVNITSLQPPLNSNDNKKNNMTVLSWLEQMHARQSDFIPEDSKLSSEPEQAEKPGQKHKECSPERLSLYAEKTSIVPLKGAVPKPNSVPAQVDLPKQKHKAASLQQLSFVGKKTSIDNLTKRATGVSHETPGIPGKIETSQQVNPVSAEKLDISAPESTQIKFPPKIIYAKKPLPVDATPVKHEASSRLTGQQPSILKQTPDAISNTMHQSVINQQLRIESRLQITEQTAKQEAAFTQQRLYGLPVTKPNNSKHKTSLARMQQALHTRIKAGPLTTSNDPSPSQTRQEPEIPKIQQTQAPVVQRVTVINPPARSNQTAAFWERSYMNRLGPRNYK